ncbi:MAG: MMPL family transporter [Methylococcaceae bacterium]|nr:MMPL family transporter [Methylococcaceae bacterium]
MKTIENKLGEWIVKFRWIVISLTLILVALAASGGKYLSFTNNYRVFFSAENPELLAFEALEKKYSKNDNVLFVLEPKSGDVFTPDVLAAIEELTEKSWQIPYSSRVDSLSNFQFTEAEEDDLIVRDLFEDVNNLSTKDIAKIKEVSMNEPLLLKRLIPEKAHVTGINVTILLPGKDESKETPEVVSFSRKIAAEIHQAHPDIEVHISGMIMMNNAFGEASRGDMAKLVPISFGVMLLMLIILTKSLTGTMLTMLVIICSILAAMGIGGYIGYPISPPSASAPTMILTIAIANSVHIIVTFLHSLQHGNTKVDAIKETIRLNLQPVFLASLTTCLGFLSMNFSDAPPFQHLGNFVAIGVAVAFILSMTFLPAMMSLLPFRTKPIQNDDDPLMTRFGKLIVNKRKPLLWIMINITVFLIAFLPQNELNDIFVNYFDETVKYRVDSDFTVENLTGVYNIEYSLSSGESGGINDPGFLKDVEAFSTWYRQQPETMHVVTLTDIITRLNKNMHGDNMDFYKLPEERELSAQYLLLYEMSLPYGLDLNNQIDVDKSSIRLISSLQTLSSNELIALNNRAFDWLKENTSHIDLSANPGSGTALMFANIGKRNIKSMLIGTTLALFMISIILIFAFKSLKIGLISLLPNLVPAALGFGLWGLIVGEVGLSLSIVTGMTLGIVVDDTVHFLSKYLRARREQGLSPRNAVIYAFSTVGRALVVTSIVLIAGFLVLSLSSFELNSGMGLLTAIVIAFALIADFLLLPTLLMKFEEKKYA